MKKLYKRLINGTMAVVGYILSPLSWWNDAFVNIPLAYLLAIPIGAINRNFFMPAVIIFYWCTNITGILMMHHGSINLIKHKENYSFRKELLKMVLVTTLYSVIVGTLIASGVLKFPTEYFVKNG